MIKKELTNICEQFDECKFSDIPVIREKFCYQGGGCPETYSSIIKEMIKSSLISYNKKD